MTIQCQIHGELRISKSLRIFVVSQHPVNGVELMHMKCRFLNGTSNVRNFPEAWQIYAKCLSRVSLSLKLNIPVFPNAFHSTFFETRKINFSRDILILFVLGKLNLKTRYWEIQWTKMGYKFYY